MRNTLDFVKLFAALAVIVSFMGCGSEEIEGTSEEEPQAAAVQYLELYTVGRGSPPGDVRSGPQRRLMAERAAVVQALLEALKEAGYGEDMLNVEEAKIMTAGYVKSYEKLEKKLFEDDSVMVRLKVIVRKRT